MFRKTEPNKQVSLLSGVNQHLVPASVKQFSDGAAWHNTFYTQVVNRIDENIFSVLFSKAQGAPNASVRTLVGMMILKEGQGYSDEQLFENCRFNLLTRKALGFVNMDDEIPAESTYYLLRKRISDYESEHQINLFDKCFEQITGGQIIEFNVSGKSIRTDSKLIGSNIAFYSRYELIHSSLMMFYKYVFNESTELLSKEDQEILHHTINEKASAIVYTSDTEQINDRLLNLGKLIHRILDVAQESNDKHYQTLKTVFAEQYKTLDNNDIEAIQGKEISAKSIQSPHDTDCDFRAKTDKKTKGYSHNLTETCNPENTVNLITDVRIEPATFADNDFIKPATKKSQEILPDKIEALHADGAYNSQANQEFVSENGIDFYLTGFQGKPARYDLNMSDNELQVIDKKTNKEVEVTLTKNNKYRIKTESGYRYFTDKEIESNRLRKQADELPKELRNRRNNVEASIFQLAYPLRKDKTKYRGGFKNKIWAILRSLWVNFVRIANKLKKEAIKVKNALRFLLLAYLYRIISILTRLESYRETRLAVS